MDPTISQSQRLNFVMNGDVTQAGAPMLMNFAAANTSPDYRAVFLRRKDHLAAGLLYTFDFSADLTQWTTSAATPALLTDPGSSGDLQADSVPYPAMVPPHFASSVRPNYFLVLDTIDLKPAPLKTTHLHDGKDARHPIRLPFDCCGILPRESS
jgi:hypothetical protein